jgi:sulfur-carrier protein
MAPHPIKVIDQYRVPREMAHLVLRNGVYVDPKQRDLPSLKEGDVIAIWPPVADG